MRRGTNPGRRIFIKRSVIVSAGIAAVGSSVGHAWAVGARAVRRVVIVNARGGVRWTASFDGSASPGENPWGILPWSIIGRGASPEWGFSRMLVQRPPLPGQFQQARALSAYLVSDDPGHYNVRSTVLSRDSAWKGATLPTFPDIAGETAVVRVTANPGGPFDGLHATATRTLCTGSPSGTTGMVSVLQRALRKRLGSDYRRQYPLPAAVIGQSGWAAMERHSADSGDLDSKVLILDMPESSAAIQDGTPTRRALSEVFGVSSECVPDGDILFDAFRVLGTSKRDPMTPSSPTWSERSNAFGLGGALTVRLLQMGSPVVALSLPGFDTHSHEVIAAQGRLPQSVQILRLTRLVAGLAFALKNVQDPAAPQRSLWDSTVIVVCSEFGRSGTDIGALGFNSPNGPLDGGSNHDPRGAWPILGGPVAAGGKLYQDRRHAGLYHQNRIFTTVLQAMGVDEGAPPSLDFETFPPIAGLLRRA